LTGLALEIESLAGLQQLLQIFQSPFVKRIQDVIRFLRGFLVDVKRLAYAWRDVARFQYAVETTDRRLEFPVDGCDILL